MRRVEHLRELDRLTSFAFDEAIRLEHSFCDEDHFLLALLHPGRDSAAARALGAAGVGYHAVSEELARLVRESDPRADEFDPEAGVVLNPKGHQLVARAEGIAVGLGDAVPREDHVLLAYLWDPWEEWLLQRCGTSRQEVYERLGAEGVPVPAVPLPQTLPPPSGRHQHVDFPADRLAKVRSALLLQLPEEVEWGWNVDPERDRAWVSAHTDDFDLEKLVEQALAEPEDPGQRR